MIATDLTALLAAIDSGDDSALIPLADCLEEQGDPRAAGLRQIWECHSSGAWRYPLNEPIHYGFGRKEERYRFVSGRMYRGGLPASLFDRLVGKRVAREALLPSGWTKRKHQQCCFPTRSAAFLALAAALVL